MNSYAKNELQLIIIFIFENKGMSFINLRQLSQLANSSKVERGYESTADSFLKKYNMKLQHEDLQNLLETASRINKRQRSKEGKGKHGQKESDYEIFVFGELKIFNWVLALYSHVNSLDLPQYAQADLTKLQCIFKKKSKIFIEYHIKDIINIKEKKGVQWLEQEIDLLKEIMNQKENESEWKSISYSLFQRSNGKYFKSFSVCRQKWISHLNPNIKKTDWSMEEDVELFTMIQNYGCRWALISRELKGIRSEHSVKNRYHVLVKTIRKQYRLGDTNQLNEKILKYLKMKLDKQKQTESQMNMSGYSLDSKCSRERSREEDKLKMNISRDSKDSREEVEEENVQFSVFDQIYYLSPQITQNFSEDNRTDNIQELALKNYYMDFKQEKKTNDQDEEEEEGEPRNLKQCFLEIKGLEATEVRTNTIEELDREYNRLLNFSDESSGFMLENAFENGCKIMDEESWFEGEEKGICWYDLA